MAQNPKFDTETVFTGIQISGIPAVQQFQSYRISGIASGKIVFSNQEMQPGKGRGEILVTDSGVDSRRPCLGLTP
ncbi:MAG: hypothetical protein R2874_09665 [Desulfobacterales bacterium]